MTEQKKNRPRVLLAVLAVAFVFVALIGALTIEPVEAAQQGVCFYFSDRTKTELVGARGTGCCGEVIDWGIVTLFKQCEELNCPHEVCPQ